MNRARVAFAAAGLIAMPAGTAAREGPAAASAEQNYVLHCRGCHGADGAGVAHRVPPLRGTLGRFMRSSEGREFVLRVPGAANSRLPDAALAAVMNWAAVTFAGGEATADLRWFTAEEVAAARRRPLLAVRNTRGEVVRRLAASGIVIADDY